jgi:YggT family protein
MTGLLDTAIGLYTWVVIAWVVFSWVPNPPEGLRPLVRGVASLVEPVVAPIRRVLPPLRFGGVALDLSALVLLLGLNLLRGLV